MPATNPRGTLRPLSVAPMMKCTDRHYRFFMRRITRHTLLYTEMVTTGGLLHGRRFDALDFHPDEHPLSLQLGGDDPSALAACARIAEDRGYDEVDLNVGCPSDRVQNGCFGASLMARPEVVAECVAAMRAAVAIPVTVKHRIGIDDLDRYEDLANFVTVVSSAGADRFSVHARKAWLQGLSPKENRTVPPLRYGDVYRLKHDFPALHIVINGGITSLAAAREHLEHVDSVMIGRAAYDDPWMFAEADASLFGDPSPGPASRLAVAEDMAVYADAQVGRGERLHRVTRHMLGLFSGVPGAKRYKRHLSEHANRTGATGDVLRDATRWIKPASELPLICVKAGPPEGPASRDSR